MSTSKQPWSSRAARAAHNAVENSGKDPGRWREQPARPFPDPGAFAQNDPRMIEARRRLRIVMFGESLRIKAVKGRVQAIESELAAPILKADERLTGPTPSRQTYKRWLSSWIACGNKIDGLITAPSTGRPKNEMDASVEKHLREHITAFPSDGPKVLHGVAVVYIEEQAAAGHALRTPTKSAVRRFRRSIPRVDISMGAFGTKATRAKIQIKATIPTSGANDWWFVDQVHFRNQVRIWKEDPLDPTKGEWILGKPPGVIVLDAHTRTPLSHWVKAPTVASPNHTGFTALETVAVIAGGILPELAHPDFEQYAIGSPKHFRMDGSGEMAAARSLLKDLGYSVPIGEANAPWIRGEIERYFRTLKSRDLAKITGNPDLYLEFDPDGEDPRDGRGRSNADSELARPVLHEIPIECYPNIEQFRALVVWALKAHIATPSRALRNRCPGSLWLETKPAPDSMVPALISVFPVHQVQVTGSGVECGFPKYNSPPLQESFANLEKVFVRADPLERGVYVYPLAIAARARSDGLFVPNRNVWVASLSPADFTKQGRAEYTALRDATNAARKRVLQRIIGEDAEQDVAKGIDERSVAAKKASKKQKRIDAAIKAKAEKAEREARGEPEPAIEPQVIPLMPRVHPVNPSARQTYASSPMTGMPHQPSAVPSSPGDGCHASGAPGLTNESAASQESPEINEATPAQGRHKQDEARPEPAPTSGPTPFVAQVKPNAFKQRAARRSVFKLRFIEDEKPAASLHQRQGVS